MGIRELAETSTPFNFIHLTDLNNDMFLCRCHLVNGISRNLLTISPTRKELKKWICLRLEETMFAFKKNFLAIFLKT